MSDITRIPITFDKSHLLTIGERLYATSLDLIRELVSNAYDADATKIIIEIRPEEIVVGDNGSGMNKETLYQYFTIGSEQKRFRPISPMFGRRRIGEFGIGKFSALSIAEEFLVETWQENPSFCARLTFDAVNWRHDPQNWTVPCEITTFEHPVGNGTRITLRQLKKTLEPIQIIRHIRERLPVGKDDFRIYVNGNEIVATSIPGKRFPVHFNTPFGNAEGEIILANLPATLKNVNEAGITVRVKNVSVTKSLFGFDHSHAIGVNRIRGAVNADFLPITSSRDRLIEDSKEYISFRDGMKRAISGVLREARQLSLQKENMQASQVLRNALDKIGRALKKNSDAFHFESDPPLGIFAQNGEPQTEGYSISKAQFVESEGAPTGNPPFEEVMGEMPLRPARRRHLSLANKAIIRRMQFRNLGIVCRMERFGPKYPPSFLEEGIIYINIDHPLYQKQENHDSLLTMFMATLLSKELALKKHPGDASAAYNLQLQLLTDAFKDAREI